MKKNSRPKEVGWYLGWSLSGNRENGGWRYEQSKRPLDESFQGKQINEQSQPEAKIQALSWTLSRDHASVGGEGLRLCFWLLAIFGFADSFWERAGSISRCDPMLPTEMGFLFMEHSFITNLAASSQEHFAKTLKEDSENKHRSPRKLVELASTMALIVTLSTKQPEISRTIGLRVRDFLLYTKGCARRKSELSD